MVSKINVARKVHLKKSCNEEDVSVESSIKTYLNVQLPGRCSDAPGWCAKKSMVAGADLGSIF